jgi:hypothetical protein
MVIGHLNQKASSPLVIFVVGCIVIIVILLWSMETATVIGENYYNEANYGQYLN